MKKSSNPLLRLVAPLTYSMCWVFVVLNLFFLAPSLYYSQGSRGLVLVDNINPSLWAVIFLTVGMGMAAGLIMNNWRLVRIHLSIGFAIKAAFGWSLMVADLSNFTVHGVTGIWLALMAMQGLCIVFFTPEVRHESH